MSHAHADIEVDLQRFKSLLDEMLRNGIYGDLEEVARRVSDEEEEQTLFVDWFSFLLHLRSKQLDPIRNLGCLDILYELDEVYGRRFLEVRFHQARALRPGNVHTQVSRLRTPEPREARGTPHAESLRKHDSCGGLRTSEPKRRHAIRDLLVQGGEGLWMTWWTKR